MKEEKNYLQKILNTTKFATCLTYNFKKHVVRPKILTTLRYRLTEEEFGVEREIELSAEKLERSLFFKTISMKETRKWNEDEDEERKDFSIFDSSISDEDQDSAYIKKTLSRVQRDKVLLVVKVEDF